MIEDDLVEAVIGLGPNLFYNSPMEACLLITSANKSKNRKGKVLIINALKELKQEKNIAFLEKNHINKIFNAYKAFKDIDGFSKVLNIETILTNKASLNIAQYVTNVETNNAVLELDEAISSWKDSTLALKSSVNQLFKTLN
jgi:type I restriction enzyme M protein